MITVPPSGTRDFLPSYVRAREKLFQTLKATLELCAFEPLDTPAFERIEHLLGKYGEEGDKLIFKILCRGDKGEEGAVDYALRYDLTVPLARVFSNNRNALSSPFKRYHIAPVWRADRPGKGRFREFYQCDFDIVGSASTLCEVEIVATASRALAAIGLDEVTVQANSRVLLEQLLNLYQIPKERHQTALIAIDKLDKIGPKGVLTELADRGISSESAQQMAGDLESPDLSKRIAEKLRSVESSAPTMLEFEALIKTMNAISGKTKVEFSPLLARGLDYYTGFIFEAYHPKFSSAIAGGGRYDGLIGTFAGQNIPACGGSLGIERLLLLLSEQELKQPRSDVMVGIWDAASLPVALGLLGRLRDAKISAELSLQTDGIGKQLKKASQLGLKYFVFQGPDEAQTGKVAVKNLHKGEQQIVPIDDLESAVRA